MCSRVSCLLIVILCACEAAFRGIEGTQPIRVVDIHTYISISDWKRISIMNRRVLSVVAAVGLIELLTTQASAQLADYIWNPALTGPQSWQVSSNWTAPTF